MNNTMRFGLGLLLTMAIAVGSSGCGMIGGALLGGIIGYQSGEALAGALIGGAIGGAGEIASAIGELGKPKECHSCQPITTCNSCPPDTVIINVANDNGSYIPVNLKRHGDEYVGPRGEYYPGIPTQDQLRPIYGL